MTLSQTHKIVERHGTPLLLRQHPPADPNQVVVAQGITLEPTQDLIQHRGGDLGQIHLRDPGYAAALDARRHDQARLGDGRLDSTVGCLRQRERLDFGCSLGDSKSKMSIKY